MEFRIADSFTESLARLTGDEQKAAKTTAFDLQLNPESPGFNLERLLKGRDKSFYSVRVSRDLRLILHRTKDSLLLCYVDHHNAAYRWAERRVLERHPKTGAAQFVEVRETVRQVEVPVYVPAEPTPTPSPATSGPPRTTPSALPLFAGVADDELLEYGVPAEWLPEVRAATEATLFEIAEHLPGEAAEALLELATGGRPQKPVQAEPEADPFEHPDAQRRFRLITDSEDLARALESPWEKWTVFLHPAQQALVTRRFHGPARVAGSAGTGKTVVAMHRAVHLGRANPGARVLLTTFSDTLARALERKLALLAGRDPELMRRITVQALDRVGQQVYEAAHGTPTIANAATVETLLAEASEAGESHRFRPRFIETEWHEVVDAWQLATWDDYRDVARLGRRTRLGEQQRAVLWAIFERARAGLDDRGLVTLPRLFARATEHLTVGVERPFDFAVVDEAQDIGVPQLRFLAALAGDREDGLFFAGDLGQRIFQTPFSWLSLGVDVRGRSSTLRINYRTSHEIRRRADLLLGEEIADVDGNVEVRRGTISAFNGPEPVIEVFDSTEEETGAVARWLRERTKAGLRPDEIGVFVRSEAELPRALAAVHAAGLEGSVLDGSPDGESGSVTIGTMHRAKGLEFRGVVVAACDDEVIPLQSRIERVGDEADLEEVYNTERHLLYVACTRARDDLLVTGVEPASEFLADLTVRRAADAG